MFKVIWRIILNVRAISTIYPTKNNNVFTGWSLLEMYMYNSSMLYMLPSANRPMLYERRLGLCVFMKLCLVYAISR